MATVRMYEAIPSSGGYHTAFKRHSSMDARTYSQLGADTRGRPNTRTTGRMHSLTGDLTYSRMIARTDARVISIVESAAHWAQRMCGWTCVRWHVLVFASACAISTAEKMYPRWSVWLSGIFAVLLAVSADYREDKAFKRLASGLSNPAKIRDLPNRLFMCLLFVMQIV